MTGICSYYVWSTYLYEEKAGQKLIRDESILCTSGRRGSVKNLRNELSHFPNI